MLSVISEAEIDEYISKLKVSDIQPTPEQVEELRLEYNRVAKAWLMRCHQQNGIKH